MIRTAFDTEQPLLKRSPRSGAWHYTSSADGQAERFRKQPVPSQHQAEREDLASQFLDRCRETDPTTPLKRINSYTHILLRTTTDFPDTGCSSSIRRRTEYQPQPPRSASEIAIRGRSHIRYERGQNWGHNSIFSGYNYRARAEPKCFFGDPDSL